MSLRVLQGLAVAAATGYRLPDRDFGRRFFLMMAGGPLALTLQNPPGGKVHEIKAEMGPC